MGPSVAPDQSRDLESRGSGAEIISMENNNVLGRRLHQYRLATWTKPASVCTQQWCTSSLHHRNATTVNIRSGNLSRAAHHRPIRAVSPAATEVPGHK